MCSEQLVGPTNVDRYVRAVLRLIENDPENEPGV